MLSWAENCSIVRASGTPPSASQLVSNLVNQSRSAGRSERHCDLSDRSPLFCQHAEANSAVNDDNHSLGRSKKLARLSCACLSATSDTELNVVPPGCLNDYRDATVWRSRPSPVYARSVGLKTPLPSRYPSAVQHAASRTYQTEPAIQYAKDFVDAFHDPVRRGT